MYELEDTLVDIMKIIFPLYFKIGNIDVRVVEGGVIVSSWAELGSLQVTGKVYFSSEHYQGDNSSITKRLKWNLVEELWRKFPKADACYISRKVNEWII